MGSSHFVLFSTKLKSRSNQKRTDFCLIDEIRCQGMAIALEQRDSGPKWYRNLLAATPCDDLFLRISQMNSFLLATLLLSPFQDTPRGSDEKSTSANQAKLEGTWTVICMEKDGQPQEDCKNAQVTIKDHMITFEPKEGKEGKGPKNLRLQFAGQGKLKVTEVEGSSSTNDSANGKEGVYVLTGDYLAVCVHSEKSGTQNTDDAAGAVSTGPTSKSKCTVILQRSSKTR